MSIRQQQEGFSTDSLEIINGTFIDWTDYEDIEAGVALAKEIAAAGGGRVYMAILGFDDEEAFLEALDWAERVFKPASDGCIGLFVTNEAADDTVMLDFKQFFDIWDVEERDEDYDEESEAE
jgi:hypothetical protein